MKKPKVGFALKKEAGEVIDSYQNYSNSVINNDEIWNSLLTEGGRQAIGAQMAVPIRTQLDYVGTARKFFEIDVLAQGQIARYDKDIDVKAYVISKRGSVNEWLVEGEYVEPTTWEVFAPASIRLKEIQERRFNILDRTQEKIRIKIQEIEDEQYLALLATTVAGNLTANPVTPSATGCDKNFMNDLSSVVMDHDLPCYGFLMRYDSFKDIRAWDNTDLDPVSMREILETGLYGTIWGIDIIVSRKVGKGVVYANTEPRFFGVMPIRTEVMLMPNDKPEEASIGYVGYENIGMVSVNANGVAVGSHN